MPPAHVASIDGKEHDNVTVDHDEQTEDHLSLNTERLIKMQIYDTFCRDVV